MSSPSQVTHALSFDIEDWFHLVGIESLDNPDTWPRLPSVVTEYTKWIVQTLHEFDVKATFFMLGWIAERYQQLAPMIVAGGHELASHSYSHRRVDTMSPEAFREDLKRSIDVIEQQTGVKVKGFRAPSFSIRPGTEWAFDVLLDAGIVYDSSLFPARRAHGGYHCPQEPHHFVNTPSGRPIREFPISVLSFGPLRLAFSGGGYLRLLPEQVIRYGFDRFAKAHLPVAVYLHPRDFAVDQPRVSMPLHRRFKSYVGLGTTERKLRMLLSRYRFDTCAKVLGVA
jgi:polysaccharide deacetylase family protein (PEP-CTERM system associated)